MAWVNILPNLKSGRIASVLSRIQLSKRFAKRPELVSLDSLNNPPPVGQLKLRNTYIPLNRRTLLRELLYDHSIISTSDREKFEQVASCLGRKFGKEFRLLENEFSVLFHPAVSTVPTSTLNPVPVPKVTESTDGVPHVRPLTKTELLDREFWLIRRLSQIATLGGFIEVPRDQLEHACQPSRSDKKQAFTFVDPRDYDVMRFWIRGVHPSEFKQASSSNQLESTGRTSTGLVNRISLGSSRMFQLMKLVRRASTRSSVSNISALFRFAADRAKKSRSSREVSFTNVLMAVRCSENDWLEVKLFNHVPAARASTKSNYTDTLPDLLPKLHFHSLTGVGRVLLASSCFVALGCVGIVIPMAWLFTVSPDLVIAWSVATAAGAGATAGLVWARHWRSLANTSEHLKQLHYNCCRGSGFQAIRSLLQAVVEEEFKSALLTYALLLESTDSNSSISPVQLGIRAESWIAKRLSPTQHTSVFPVDALEDLDFPKVTFTGGSGPLFDLVYDAERSLKILRRLNLVHGPEFNPQAVPLTSAVTALKSDYDSNDDLDSLWILDALATNVDDKRT